MVNQAEAAVQSQDIEVNMTLYFSPALGRGKVAVVGDEN